MNIWKIIYLNCGERSKNMTDHRSYTHNLSSCEIKACKKIQAWTGFKPMTSAIRCSALPTELSSHLGAGHWWQSGKVTSSQMISHKFRSFSAVQIYDLWIHIFICNIDLVVSGTFLSIQSPRADLKQNLGTFLAFFCFSNKNISKWKSKGPGVEFKVRGYGSYRFHVNSTVIQECNFPRHI